MKNILILGSSGFIGSETTDKLEQEKKYNLYFLSRQKTFYPNTFIGDIQNIDSLKIIFRSIHLDAVLILYGLKSIAGSSNVPLYFNNELNGLNNVLSLCAEYGCKKIVYLSSSAVYTSGMMLNEESPFSIKSFYSFLKITAEEMLKWYKKYSGIEYVILRCANVCGKTLKGRTNKDIITLAIEEKKLCVFGNSFNTEDGTLIRDYIHVSDVANAICKALEYESSDIFNIGTQKGYSVLEIIKLIQDRIKEPVEVNFTEKRAIDESFQVLDISKAKTKLQWNPSYEIEDIIDSLLFPKPKSKK